MGCLDTGVPTAHYILLMIANLSCPSVNQICKRVKFKIRNSKFKIQKFKILLIKLFKINAEILLVG